MNEQQLRAELRRLREDSARRGRERERRLASGELVPLSDPDAGPRAGAYADDDPELHRAFARGDLDEELLS